MPLIYYDAHDPTRPKDLEQHHVYMVRTPDTTERLMNPADFVPGPVQSDAHQDDVPIQRETVALAAPDRTKLEKNTSILVDPGSRINLAGQNTLATHVSRADDAGQQTKTYQASRFVEVSGVGSGSHKCTQKALTPIAVRYKNSPTTIDKFDTYVVKGDGSELPMIMGLDSLTEKDAVLVFRQGKRFLAMPGKGGYKIEWSPGTLLLPLEQAPSGHLVFSVDHFQEARDSSEIRGKREVVFCTDHYTGQDNQPSSE